MRERYIYNVPVLYIYTHTHRETLNIKLRIFNNVDTLTLSHESHKIIFSGRYVFPII